MKHGIRVSLLALGLAGVGAGVTAGAQNVRKGPLNASVKQPHIGMVQDWSHRQVIFSGVKTFDETVALHRSPARWERLAKDPRFVMALTRRFQSEAGTQTLHDSRTRGHDVPPPAPDAESGIHRDWSNVLGGGTDGLGGNGIQGMYPAKYNFDIAAAPSCVNDFIVYPTNTAGATSSGAPETRPSTFTNRPNAGDTFTIGVTGTARSVVLTAVDTVTAANQFYRGANTGSAAARAAVAATNLAAAVVAWSGQTGITASASTANVVFARISNSDTASITISSTSSPVTYAVGTRVNGSGTAGQPTIIAFNQLYNTTCNATRSNANAPNVLWSYNTGTGYVTESSPTLSYYDDGKQVVFIQRNGTVMQLVVLRGKSGDGKAGVPATPAIAATAADYRNGTGACAGGVACMFAITLNGTTNAGGTQAYSSPFMDYAADVAWVGDNNGRLHKFTGVFNGTPAEVTAVGSGFPATVSAAGIKLSPPVYDFAGNVFVGSSSGAAGVGGMLHKVNASTGAVTSTAKMAINNSTGLRSSPILDPSTQRVYAFLFNDGSPGNAGGTTCHVLPGNDNGCRLIVQFSTNFAAGASGGSTWVGRGNDQPAAVPYSNVLYTGMLDDAYYNSSNGTGNMYIVGGSPDDTDLATLWKVPVSAGVLGTPLQGAQIASKDNTFGRTLSPLTLIKNGSNEYLYFSTTAIGTAQGCAGACIYMMNLADLNGPDVGTPTTWATTNKTSAGLPVFGGTTGIIVDNISATAGTSQVYFSHLASPGNAVQASQSGLN